MQASSGVQGGLPQEIIWIFLLKLAFPGFPSHSNRILARLELENCFFITKNLLIMKNMTDFRKTVELSVDPRLLYEPQVKNRPKIALYAG